MENDLMKNCKRFNSCNAPLCPLYKEVNFVVRLPEDDICIYCRTQKKRGIRKTMPKDLLAFVLKENYHLLSEKSRRNASNSSNLPENEAKNEINDPTDTLIALKQNL